MSKPDVRPGQPSQRQLRVGELIRHALSDILTRGEIIDDELSKMLLTVPEVRISPDLKNATVYVTPLAGGDPIAAVKALARHKKWIRGQIAHRVNLKSTPEFAFRHDDRFEESARLEALFRAPEVAQDLKPVSGDDSDDEKGSA